MNNFLIFGALANPGLHVPHLHPYQWVLSGITAYVIILVITLKVLQRNSSPERE